MRGLVPSSREYHDILEEAVATHMPAQLRDLFAQLLVHCEPSEPRTLWEEFQHHLADDFVRKSTNKARDLNAALHAVNLLLHSHGKTAGDYDLPLPDDFDPSEFRDRHLRHALDFDSAAEATAAEVLASQLNDEQRAAYSAIVAALDDPTTGVRGNAFYVDGPGGAGKTFLYEALMRLVHGRGQIALACAMSGIAATLLPGGTTAHSLFGLPLDMPSHGASSSIRAQDGRAEVLRRATLIVWDEASMVPAAALDCVDRLMRDLMASTTPFGGKLLVMGGDFRQLLPVMPKATEA